jgi:hypothetical protein
MPNFQITVSRYILNYVDVYNCIDSKPRRIQFITEKCILYYLFKSIKSWFSCVKSREDGPAVVWFNGHKEWWVNGLRHREDGPAVEKANGSKEWWVHGKRHGHECALELTIAPYILTYWEVYHSRSKPITWTLKKLLEFKVVQDKEQTTYYLDNKKHREDGPAVENRYGKQEWWVNGKRHRKDGPAVDCCSTREWWVNGKLHRKNGPAVQGLVRHEWWTHGELHREDGPAVDGLYRKEWWVHGKPVYI